jgi:hypothetical protein
MTGTENKYTPTFTPNFVSTQCTCTPNLLLVFARMRIPAAHVIKIIVTVDLCVLTHLVQVEQNSKA